MFLLSDVLLLNGYALFELLLVQVQGQVFLFLVFVRDFWGTKVWIKHLKNVNTISLIEIGYEVKQKALSDVVS